VYGGENPYYKEYKEKVTKYKDSTKYVMDIAIQDESKMLISQYFSNSKYVQFEMMKMRIQEKYENILNTYYVDWHNVVRGGDIHVGCIFDVKVPYSQYLDKEK